MLLEVSLQSLFEYTEPSAVFLRIGDIREYANEVVSINSPFMLPDAANVLRLK